MLSYELENAEASSQDDASLASIVLAFRAEFMAEIERIDNAIANIYAQQTLQEARLVARMEGLESLALVSNWRAALQKQIDDLHMAIAALLPKDHDHLVQTTDATPKVIATYVPRDGAAVLLVAEISASEGSTNMAAYTITVGARRDGAVATIVGTPAKAVISEDVAAWDVNVAAVDDVLKFSVTGEAATDISWRCSLRVVAAP